MPLEVLWKPSNMHLETYNIAKGPVEEILKNALFWWFFLALLGLAMLTQNYVHRLGTILRYMVWYQLWNRSLLFTITETNRIHSSNLQITGEHYRNLQLFVKWTQCGARFRNAASGYWNVRKGRGSVLNDNGNDTIRKDVIDWCTYY